MKLNVNGQAHEIDVDPNMPLLWALRDIIGYKGTKYGCGIAQCGACTVHLNGAPVRSCRLAVGNVGASTITTIEGLGTPDAPHALQQAWIDHQVAQCGYCQSGQIMQAAGLLAQIPDPSDEDIDRYMRGNLCRCGAYPRIREAIKAAAEESRES